MVRKLAEATGSISISMRGEKGESGDTPYVTKTVVDYAITSSVSEAKKWSSTAPDASAASNKGKFLWTRTTYTWSNNKTTENITYTYIGKDGKDGTSVTIKGSKGSTSELPTSGNTLGDGYIISGYLWVYTGTTKSDTTHVKGFENVGKIQGEPGQPATQYYTHIAWMKDSKGTGFTTSASGGEYPYVGVLVDKTSTDSTDWTKYDWSYVKGAPGATGNGIKSTEVTYQIGSSGTTPPKDGVWDTKIPNITDEKPYLWTRTIFKYTNGTDSEPSYSVATRGTKGALMREHDGFESGSYKYLSGSGAEEYVDVVYIKDSKKWWQCIVSYNDATSSPKLDDGHWGEMNNYKSIATHLLLAENATINMLGTNQINLFNPTDTTDSKMYGSFRVVNNDSDWSLWLGGKDGDSASFAVTRGGAIKATAGTIGSFTIRELQGGYYDFYANYKGIVNFSAPSSISLNSRGISASTGVPGNGAQFFFGNNEITEDTPSWENGALKVTLSTPYGANSSQTAAYISAMGKSGYTANALELSATGGTDNHAIAIRNGDVIGLRPSFTRLSANYQTLTEYDHTVQFQNTSEITVYLPSSPKYGQCYTIIQGGAKVTFSTNKSIYDPRSNNTSTTWYSNTRGQVSWFWYNGGQWIVCYASR